MMAIVLIALLNKILEHSLAEMPTTAPTRKCWNAKSRKHPDAVCSRSATFGDFCSFHYKNPRRFVREVDMSCLTKRKKARLERFAAICRLKVGLMMARRQGPAVTTVTLANNSTELASMESLETIYRPFRFSFIENGNMWLFDIRTLLMEKKRVESKPFLNPYTSIPIESSTLVKLQSHMQWLLRRNYVLDYSVEDTLPVGPIYQQKIMELCFLIDSHGYLTNYAWFEIPTVLLIRRYIDKLNQLWSTGLDLTNGERHTLYPSWTPGTALVPFIRPASSPIMLNNLLTFLLEFVKAAEEKEMRALTAVHILTALTHVSDGTRRSFPWLFQ